MRVLIIPQIAIEKIRRSLRLSLTDASNRALSSLQVNTSTILLKSTEYAIENTSPDEIHGLNLYRHTGKKDDREATERNVFHLKEWASVSEMWYLIGDCRT